MPSQGHISKESIDLPLTYLANFLLPIWRMDEIQMGEKGLGLAD